jgi:hypothetical protein
MIARWRNPAEIDNFLSAALESNASTPSFLEKAISILQGFNGRQVIHKSDYLILVKLQLLFQKLGEFELALDARAMLSMVIGLDEITKSKNQIDNANIPSKIFSCVPLVKSRNDARFIYSMIKLNKTLGDKCTKSIATGLSPNNRLRYLDYILGKKVAIVGPAHAKKLRGSEIDDHDIVVRINIKGDDSLPDSRSHGLRTDVIYLNGVWTDSFTTSNYQTLLNSNCHFVWRTRKNKHKVLKSHSLTGIDNLEVSGSFLMLPRIVFDLLQFNPASINVFHNDFYSGKNVYEQNFNSRRNAQTMWDLADHDLLTSLNFMNLLMLRSKTSINFIDSEFGNKSLDLRKYSSLVQRRDKS